MIRSYVSPRFNMKAQLFYNELGLPFSSLGRVDGGFSAKGSETVQRIVQEPIMPVEAGMDHHGTDQAYVAEFEFEVLVDRDATSQETFTSLIACISQDTNELSVERKSLICRSAHDVAHVAHGIRSGIPLVDGPPPPSGPSDHAGRLGVMSMP